MGHKIVLKTSNIPESTFRVFAGETGKSLQITIREEAIQLLNTAVFELNAKLREEFAPSELQAGAQLLERIEREKRYLYPESKRRDCELLNLFLDVLSFLVTEK